MFADGPTIAAADHRTGQLLLEDVRVVVRIEVARGEAVVYFEIAIRIALFKLRLPAILCGPDERVEVDRYLQLVVEIQPGGVELELLMRFRVNHLEESRRTALNLFTRGGGHFAFCELQLGFPHFHKLCGKVTHSDICDWMSLAAHRLCAIGI